jgi:hypothetical protein
MTMIFEHEMHKGVGQDGQDLCHLGVMVLPPTEN